MKTHRTLIIGGLLATAGATLFTAKVIVAKLMYAHGMAPLGVLALRMTFALPFFLVPAARDLARPATRPPLVAIALTCLTGILAYYGASLFDFTGVQYISTALERMILTTYPSVVMLLGIFVLGRALEPRLLLAFAIGYAGVGLMLREEFALAERTGGHPLLGAGYIVLSVLCFSTAMLGAERLMRDVGSRRYTSLAMTAACVAILTHYVVTQGLVLPTREPVVLGLGVVIGLCCTVIPVYAFNKALQLVGAQRVGLFNFGGVGISFVFSSLILDEPFTPVKTLGILVAMAGSAIVILSKRPQEPAPAAPPAPAKEAA